MTDAGIVVSSPDAAGTAASAALAVAHWPAETSVPLCDLTVGELLRGRAAAHPDALALVATGVDGKEVRLTYGDLLARASAIAAGLLELAAPGELVALWAPNVAEWPLVQYGAALAGVVLVALNPVLRADELQYALEHSGAVILLHADRSRDYDLAAVVAAVAPSCPVLRETISLSETQRYTATAREELPAPEQLDPVMLQYTSGTTGQPKGVLLHHRALVNVAKLTLECTDVPSGAVCLNPLPMFHTAACVVGTLGPLWIGGAMVLLQQFSPAAALKSVRKEGATVLMSVPTLLGAVLEAASNDGPAPHLDRVLVGAANVPATMIERVEQVFGASVHNLFGQTELGPVLTCIRPGDTRADQVATVGRPLPHVEVRILDPVSGDAAALGVSGEICARGYQQMICYYRDPEATAAAVDAEAWLHTGDLGSMDERGVVTLTGRLKDLIIRGGENIAPAQVENVLVSHPAVLDAAVVGLPDETWGEVVAAAVRLRTPLDDPHAELTAYCRERLAPFKVPVRFEVVDDYPMTPSGKVQKFRLREQLVGGHTRGELTG